MHSLIMPKTFLPFCNGAKMNVFTLKIKKKAMKVQYVAKYSLTPKYSSKVLLCKLYVRIPDQPRPLNKFQLSSEKSAPPPQLYGAKFRPDFVSKC